MQHSGRYNAISKLHDKASEIGKGNSTWEH